MSYLSDVKSQVEELVEGLKMELVGAESVEFPDIMSDWQKELWPLIEKALKTSYRNGQKAGIGGDKPAKKKRAWQRDGGD